MARKRMIDPDFWTDEALGRVDRTSRLLFMGLISHSDDEGRLRGNAALVRSQVFPYDEDLSASDVDQRLNELHSLNLIRRYDVDGQQFIWIVNFNKHQTINKPSASKLPDPEVACTGQSGTTPILLPEDYGSDPVVLPPKRKEEKRREENIPRTRAGSAADVTSPEGAPVNGRASPEAERRELLFETFVRLWLGYDWPSLTREERREALTKSERGRINAAVGELVDKPQATPDEVERRWQEARRRSSPEVTITPNTITKSWSSLAASPVGAGTTPLRHDLREWTADDDPFESY